MSYEKKIKSLIPKGYAYDPELISPRLGTIVAELLQPRFPTLLPEALLLVLIAKVSYVLSIEHPVVQSDFIHGGINQTTPSCFAMLFIRSGGGKDMLRKTIDNLLLCDVNKDFEKQFSIKRGIEIDLLQKLAEEKYKTKSQIDNFVKNNSPKKIRLSISRGTPEGLESYAKTVETLNYGGIFYQHNEFTDVFLRVNDKNEVLIEYLKNIYDGNLDTTLLKTQDGKGVIEGLVGNVLIYSSPYGLESEAGTNKLFELFGRGYARRAFVCSDLMFNNNHKEVNIEDAFEHNKTIVKNEEKNAPVFRKWFNEMFRATQEGGVITFNDDAFKLIVAYRAYCELMDSKSKVSNRALKVEITGRAWRAFQLAAIVGLFEHPDEWVINQQDVETAIHLTEVYAKHFYSFFEELSNYSDETVQIFRYLEDNIDKPVSMMKLRSLKIIPSYRFSSWFEQNIDMLHQMAVENGYSEVSLDNDGTKKTVTLYGIASKNFREGMAKLRTAKND